jgi:hypothetical protein
MNQQMHLKFMKVILLYLSRKETEILKKKTLYHRSPIWIIIRHTYLLWTSLHRIILHTKTVNFHHFILTVILLLNPKLKLNSVALVRERTIPTERPPPGGEVSANFCG